MDRDNPPDEIDVRIGEGFVAKARFGEKLIDLCERTAAPIAFNCRAGSCGTCAIVVLSGMGHLSPVGDGERIVVEDLETSGDDVRLACQVRIFGRAHVKPVG